VVSHRIPAVATGGGLAHEDVSAFTCQLVIEALAALGRIEVVTNPPTQHRPMTRWFGEYATRALGATPDPSGELD
jgi:hypothetical protein